MIDSKICPFCKEANSCQANIPNSHCWCKDIEIPYELLELLPSKYRNKACICKNCIELFKKDRDRFIKEFTTNI